jgi:hypothetical protein
MGMSLRVEKRQHAAPSCCCVSSEDAPQQQVAAGSVRDLGFECGCGRQTLYVACAVKLKAIEALPRLKQNTFCLLVLLLAAPYLSASVHALLSLPGRL